VETEKSETTYMVVFEDLFTSKSNPVERFHDVDSKRPKLCEECDSKEIVNLEVLGVQGSVFWVCLECDALYLKYKLKETLLRLRKAQGTWTNPNDWGWQDESEFN
tara:strand:+ start:14850 stop:15164 length:315 start_codon:yes stop_codon:yes gene_type:complete